MKDHLVSPRSVARVSRAVWLGLGAASLALAASAPVHAAPGDVEVLATFPAPNQSPDGIALKDGHLFITECSSSIVNEIDPDTGAVLAKHNVPGTMLDHITWDGPWMWANDHDGKTVFHKIDSGSWTVAHQIKVPWSPMGAVFDGQHLWSMDPAAMKVYRIDPETEQMEAVFDVPGVNPCGIGFDGQCLWISDLTLKTYTLIDRETGTPQLSFELPGPASKLPTGIAYDGESFWALDEDPKDPTIFKLKVELPAEGPCAAGAPVSEPDAGSTADTGGGEDVASAVDAGSGEGSEDIGGPQEDVAGSATGEDVAVGAQPEEDTGEAPTGAPGTPLGAADASGAAETGGGSPGGSCAAAPSGLPDPALVSALALLVVLALRPRRHA